MAEAQRYETHDEKRTPIAVAVAAYHPVPKEKDRFFLDT